MRTIALLLAGGITVAGLVGCVVVEERPVYERRPLYAQPEPVYAQPQPAVVAEPVIVEYGAVPPPAVITEYVYINGGYYYYYPERRVFVHLGGPPPQGAVVRRINSWSEHPMYARVQHVAPPRPVVVAQPQVVAVPVVVAPPIIVEANAVVRPPVVSEYVLLNGAYYYYHPGRHVFVHIAGAPPRGAAVREIHSWNEHPMYDKVEHVEAPHR